MKTEKNKRKSKAGVIVFFIILIVAISCGAIYINSNYTSIGLSDRIVSLEHYNVNDFTYDKEKASYIELQGDKVYTQDQDIIILNNTQVCINQEGTYVFQGTLNDGQILVNTKKRVRIILNNVDITCKDGPAILVKDADNAYITLEENTVNKLKDGELYKDNELSATIFSKDDLIINGKGSLEIEANYLDGISTNDDLKIISGNIEIKAKRNGIRGKDSVLIKNGDINITAGKDGIKATNKKSGTIEITDGNIYIKSGRDGIQAKGNITVDGGRIKLFVENSQVGEVVEDNEDEEETSSSHKAIKSKNMVIINAGDFIINSIEDGIYAVNDIQIKDGKVYIVAIENGINSEEKVMISNGNVIINNTVAAINANEVQIDGGNLEIVPSKNGIYAKSNITLNGGNVTINSDSDYYSVDCMNDFIINGGTIVAINTADIKWNLKDSSSQYALLADNDMYNNEKKNVIEMEDIKFETENKINNVLISTEKLQKDKNCILKINDTKTKVVMDEIIKYVDVVNDVD